MDLLALTYLGYPVLRDLRAATALNVEADGGERAADRLPPSTPVRPPRGSGGRSAPSTGRSGDAGPSPFSTLFSSATRTNSTPMTAQSIGYLSGNESSSASSVADAPSIFLIAQNPATLGGNGLPVGIPRGIVLPLSAGQSARDVIPIPDLPPGTAMPVPPPGYLYGRAAPTPPPPPWMARSCQGGCSHLGLMLPTRLQHPTYFTGSSMLEVEARQEVIFPHPTRIRIRIVAGEISPLLVG